MSKPKEKWIQRVLDIGADLYSQACTKCEEAYGDSNEVDCTHCEAKLLHRKLKAILTRRLKEAKDD
jgi:uncharacterized paraquat-inducible protein A